MDAIQYAKKLLCAIGLIVSVYGLAMEPDMPELHEAARDGDLVRVKELVSSGTDVNVKDNDGYTPLHWAARYGKLPAVHYLVKHDADVNAKTSGGLTPLLMATADGDLPSVQYLIEHGAEVNAKTNGGWTPLHWAARCGKLPVVQHLVVHHANVNAKNELGQTPLRCAEERRNLSVVNYLTRVANLMLLYAAKIGDLVSVTNLVSSGADVNVKDYDGWTSLHRAAKNGHLPVVQYLVEHGADVNVKDNDGWTSLHHAAKNGHLPVVQYLVEHGADVNVKDSNDKTPLHYAAEYGHLPVVKHLVELGANVNAKDNKGETPLCLAKAWSNLSVVNYLTEVDCSICLTKVQLAHMIMLGCGHLFCKECLMGLLNNAIQEQTAQDLRCPERTCGGPQQLRYSLEFEDIDKITEGLENAHQLKSAYQQIKTNDYLRVLGTRARQCPTTDCKNVWEFEHVQGLPDAAKFKCFCGKKYCVNCVVPWDRHVKDNRFLPCEAAKQYHEELKNETPEGQSERQAREVALREGGFYCINGCKNMIIRAAGCDHMICGRDTHGHASMEGCGYDFCIRCMLPWEGHGQQWYGGGCTGALQHLLNAGNRWAKELHRWQTETPGRTIAGDNSGQGGGRDHWIRLCQAHGYEKVIAFLQRGEPLPYN